jgi:hypothetical protein
MSIMADETPAAAAAATPAPVATPAATNPDRPNWLLDKYKTVEEQARALPEHIALRAREQAEAAAKAGALAIPDTPAQPFADDNATVETVLEKVGIPEQVLAEEVAANDGHLKPETYAKFKALGFGKGVVDGVIAQRATMRRQIMLDAVGQAEKLAGGPEQLNSLLKFAGTLPEHVKAGPHGLRARLADPATAAGAVLEIKGHYDVAVQEGKVPTMAEGDRPAAGNAGEAKAYDNPHEVRAAIRDPRYVTDPVYRKEVVLRLQKTPDHIRMSVM